MIEQVQFTGAESVSAGSNKVNLHFNHPVKELVWVLNGTCSGADTNVSYVSVAKLQLNGHDRFKEETGDYFMHVQRFQHHTGVGGANTRCATHGKTTSLQLVQLQVEIMMKVFTVILSVFAQKNINHLVLATFPELIMLY